MSKAFSRFTVRGGSIYNSEQTGHIANFVNGSQAIDNSSTTSNEKQVLHNAVKKIRSLLQQLESENPMATEAEQKTYVNDETSVGFKRRVAQAMHAEGKGIPEELSTHPQMKPVISILYDWAKL